MGLLRETSTLEKSRHRFTTSRRSRPRVKVLFHLTAQPVRPLALPSGYTSQKAGTPLP
jgi:hypothetical protein